MSIPEPPVYPFGSSQPPPSLSFYLLWDPLSTPLLFFREHSCWSSIRFHLSPLPEHPGVRSAPFSFLHQPFPDVFPVFRFLLGRVCVTFFFFPFFPPSCFVLFESVWLFLSSKNTAPCFRPVRLRFPLFRAAGIWGSFHSEVQVDPPFFLINANSPPHSPVVPSPRRPLSTSEPPPWSVHTVYHPPEETPPTQTPESGIDPPSLITEGSSLHVEDPSQVYLFQIGREHPVKGSR